MYDYLQIYEPRERLLVGCADTLLTAAAWAVRAISRRPSLDAPRRILLLRLERIGDLLMALAALDAVRARAPRAQIHLVIGSWNASIAELLSSVDTHEILDAPWLARHTAGQSAAALARRAWSWRTRQFDLAVNFEPDIRSNALLALSGAPRRAGFRSGGGSSLLTDALDYNPRQHTSANLVRLVDAVLPPSSPVVGDGPALPHLHVPEGTRQQAAALLAGASGHAMKIGIHVSGGRAIKQWDLERFAHVAARVSRAHHAAIVFTGTDADRPLVERVTSLLPADIPFISVVGAVALDTFAALLQQLDLLITGDTGPMHLAAAAGAPVVAIFGPSDPARYSPLTKRARILTADLWCRPCNRIRRPPARCTNGTPDCLQGVTVDAVVDAAAALLAGGTR